MSEEEVREVRKLATDGLARAEIQKKTGFSKGQVGDTLRRTTHKRVEETEDKQRVADVKKETSYVAMVKHRLEQKSTKEIDVNGNEHWLYNGYLDPSGYGTASYHGKQELSHRLSFAVFHNHGKLPDDLLVRHKCRYKNCCNPRCLETGTAADNMLDKKRDGTLQFGEKHCNASITEEKARKIKFSRGNGSKSERAARFNTSISVVSHIDRGATWKHLIDGKYGQ